MGVEVFTGASGAMYYAVVMQTEAAEEYKKARDAVLGGAALQRKAAETSRQARNWLWLILGVEQERSRPSYRQDDSLGFELDYETNTDRQVHHAPPYSFL